MKIGDIEEIGVREVEKWTPPGKNTPAPVVTPAPAKEPAKAPSKAPEREKVPA